MDFCRLWIRPYQSTPNRHQALRPALNLAQGVGALAPWERNTKLSAAERGGTGAGAHSSKALIADIWVWEPARGQTLFKSQKALLVTGYSQGDHCGKIQSEPLHLIS